MLSLIPGQQLPETDIDFLDIIVHIAMYGTLFGTFIWEGRRQFIPRAFRYTVSFFLIFLLMGGVIEVLQETLIPGRFGSWSDFLANGLGLIVGMVIIPIAGQNEKESQ